MSYKIIPYSPHHLAGLTRLLDQAFHIQNPSKEALVQWKFFAPYLKEATVMYVALDEEDQVVAQYSNVPIQIQNGSHTYPAMICTDMATAVQHRRKGLISSLSQQVYKVIQTTGTRDLSIGFSNTAGVVVDKFASNYHYQVVGNFVTYYKYCLFAPQSNIRLIPITIINDEMEIDTNSSYLHIHKEKAYLAWRYYDKPNNQYVVYKALSDTKCIGYIVLKFLNKKCYVCDIISGDDTSQWPEILATIEKTAKDHKCKIVVFYVLENTFWQKVLKRYWRRKEQVADCYFTIKIHNQSLYQPTFLDKENWRIMNGDIL